MTIAAIVILSAMIGGMSGAFVAILVNAYENNKEEK